MRIKNLKPVAQTIDAANGMVVEGGKTSGDLPKALALSLLKNQPFDWAKVGKPTKPSGGE